LRVTADQELPPERDAPISNLAKKPNGFFFQKLKQHYKKMGFYILKYLLENPLM